MNESINNHADGLSAFIEPVFYFGLKKSSKIPDCLAPKCAFNFFEYRLKQNPKDLSCHLQRVRFALSEKNKDEVFAAICDLFIILGALGLPLRQRLFAGCKKVLDQQQIEMLSRYLTDDVLSSKLSFLPNNCFFKERPVDLIQLCDRSIHDVKECEDIMRAANSYIENSQLNTALEYMITHLEQDPENEELAVKLIMLYKALGYTNEFQKAYTKFENHLMTSRYWDAAKQYYLNQ